MSSQESKNVENASKRQADKKKQRRTRKDQQGRDYVCACGKSYLSYPALYTHIKTKHDGKAPKMTEQQQRNNMKEDLEQLKMFLGKFYPERLRATPLNDLGEVLLPEQKQYILPLLYYWQTEEKNQKPYVQRKSLIPAKQVFAKFIYDMNKRVNSSCIRFLVKLIMYIIKGVCIEKKNDKYCQQCTASLVPSLFNDLILNGHIPIEKDSSEKIFSDSEAICKVMVYFSNWLFNQKYTNYSVKQRSQ